MQPEVLLDDEAKRSEEDVGHRGRGCGRRWNIIRREVNATGREDVLYVGGEMIVEDEQFRPQVTNAETCDICGKICKGASHMAFDARHAITYWGASALFVGWTSRPALGPFPI